jgi:hypothetical protein
VLVAAHFPHDRQPILGRDASGLDGGVEVDATFLPQDRGHAGIGVLRLGLQLLARHRPRPAWLSRRAASRILRKSLQKQGTHPVRTAAMRMQRRAA